VIDAAASDGAIALAERAVAIAARRRLRFTGPDIAELLGMALLGVRTARTREQGVVHKPFLLVRERDAPLLDVAPSLP
jgi:hypothetical protein